MRAALALAVVAAACGKPSPTIDYQRVMIPMRDGVQLETVILSRRPHLDGPRPIVLERSPYGVPGPEIAGAPLRGDELASDDVLVFQNLRGRFGSQGTFVMLRPPHDPRDAHGVDETTDAYDTIAWLVKHVPGTNGRVCMVGGSYDAWTATMALLGPHPALRCVIEEASPADMFLNDDFHHNGAFRLSYGFEYAALLETSADADTSFQFDLADTYDWYLRLGALPNADARYLHGKMPTWESFVQHPDRDAFWQAQAITSHLTGPTVPILNVAGWWDQEDAWGPITIYEQLEAHDDAHRNALVVGPWNHGGWEGDGSKLGDLTFGSDTGAEYRTHIRDAFLDHWLRDAPLDLPEATIFETGTNRWRHFDRWPPVSTPRRLYLRAGGALSLDPPTDDDGADAYVSDPASPVPYRPRPVSPTYPGPAWPLWLVMDQRFVEHRPDVLTYQTGVLDHDITIAGDVVADLWASTSGTDSDWVVKLIDVLPDGGAAPSNAAFPAAPAPPDLRGYELMVADEILRGRYRDDFARPAPIPAGQPIEYHLDLHTRSHVFARGHRIMVQVQSSWFPLYDRNPQTFVPNIYTARDRDYVAATQRIYRSRAMASSVILPVP